MTRLRRPGAPWRLRVHEWRGRQPGRREGDNGIAHDVTSTPGARDDSEWHRTHVLPPTEFDELVVGQWLHIEQMNARVWWMAIGGVVVHVTVDRDGRPRHVRVEGPGDYDDPVDGCTYRLDWGAHHEDTRSNQEEV